MRTAHERRQPSRLLTEGERWLYLLALSPTGTFPRCGYETLIATEADLLDWLMRARYNEQSTKEED